MDAYVQEKDGNVFCLRHNEKITMFIMDQQVPFNETLLCFSCFQDKNTVSNKIISLQKAKQMIQEKNFNSNINQSSASQINDLSQFSLKIMDYKNRVNQSSDFILQILELWIQDLGISKNQNNLKSLLQQLQELHLNNQETNQDKKIDMTIQAHKNKLINKLKTLQEESIKFEERIKEFFNQFLNQINIKQIDNIPNKQQIIKIKEAELAYLPKKCKQISVVQQIQDCSVIAFNKLGSLMVAGCKYDIKVWKFDKGKLNEQKALTGHTSAIFCLIFSKSLNWFVSGSRDSTIRGWIGQGNDWISSSPQQQHTNSVNCLLLSNNEKQLISCSSDKTIKVWDIDCLNNQIKLNYSLDKKHTNSLFSISLNQNETALVSCSSDNKIILWMKGINQKWDYVSHIDGYYVQILIPNCIYKQ